MPIRTPLSELNKLLLGRYRAWSEVAEAQPRPGLRAITIDGAVLRAVVVQRAQEKFFNAIAALLPSDFTLMDLDGEMIRMRWSHDGNYRDAYVVIVASEQWPPMEEGAVIAELDLTLSRDWWRAVSG